MVCDFLRAREREVAIVDSEGFVKPRDFGLHERFRDETVRRDDLLPLSGGARSCVSSMRLEESREVISLRNDGERRHPETIACPGPSSLASSRPARSRLRAGRVCNESGVASCGEDEGAERARNE